MSTRLVRLTEVSKYTGAPAVHYLRHDLAGPVPASH